MLQKQLQENITFLKKAYEVPFDYSPSSPLSVNMNPIEVGKTIGFDKVTVTRIMTELVQSRYVDSGLGMGMLLIRREGLNYLREMESEMNTSPSINIVLGDNSNFQFQSNSPNSNQVLQLKEQSTEDLFKLVQEIKEGLNILQKYLSPAEIEDLKTETSYLENTLKKQSPDKSLLKTVTNNVLDILKAVPSNVIANMITNIIQ
jgi:hypothetical protein